jgi:hypothetical protein
MLCVNLRKAFNFLEFPFSLLKSEHDAVGFFCFRGGVVVVKLRHDYI